ncbi:hypothetical protein DMA11_09765 [Marinilabiliaceae bacterium JC017]|nr:hypothetical protein DMA11_09765 [Marinilabiliaceae bacterium JC017]
MPLKLLIFLFALTFLNACVVSKKKYEALMLEKNQLSTQLDEKTTENSTLKSNLESSISDYEEMKYELNKSNALKSDELSDLLIQMTSLRKESEELNEKLKNTLQKYKAKEENNAQTTEELEHSIHQLRKLQKDTASLQYSLKLAKERNDMMRSELQKVKEQSNNNYKKRAQLEKDLNAQIAKLSTIESQLVKNKSTMDDISKAFIDLRKEMLSAKSKNKSLDPNKNKQIDKIAKLLGHY